MADWKALEDEVVIAIKKDCPINFDSKTIEECKYQQKVAEDKRLRYERVFNVSIFVAAIGFPFLINGFITNQTNEIFIGFIYIFIAIVLSRKSLTGNMFKIFSRIILDAEKRILSEDNLKQEPPQETVNTPPQVQENTPSKGQSIGQIEFIKARLDLNKMIMSALFGFMLVIAWTTIQNIHTWDRNIIATAIIINLSFGIIIEKYRKIYVKIMNELKDLP